MQTFASPAAAIKAHSLLLSVLASAGRGWRWRWCQPQGCEEEERAPSTGAARCAVSPHAVPAGGAGASSQAWLSSDRTPARGDSRVSPSPSLTNTNPPRTEGRSLGVYPGPAPTLLSQRGRNERALGPRMVASAGWGLLAAGTREGRSREDADRQRRSSLTAGATGTVLRALGAGSGEPSPHTRPRV